jgi:hypothetical protein
MVTKRDGELVVTRREDLLQSARATGWTVLFFCLLAGGTRVLGWEMRATWALLGVAGLFAVVALLLHRFVPRVYVSLDDRTIRRDRDSYALDDVVAVRLGTFVETTKTERGVNRRSQNFDLDFIVDDEERTASLEQAIALRREAVARGGEMAAADQKAIGEGLSDLPWSLPTIELGHHRDPAIVWRSAEQLARELRLPILDTSGTAIELRVAEEIDLPWRERLERNLAVVPEGDETDTRAMVSEDRLVMTWHHLTFFELFLGLGLVLPFLVLAVVFLDVPFLAFLFAVVGVGFAPLTLHFLRGQGKHTLELTLEQLRYRCVPFGPFVTLPLEDVETARVNRRLVPSLDVISDERILRLPMKTLDEVKQRRHTIVAWLKRSPVETEGPYR